MIFNKIKDRIDNYDGSIGICYIDLQTGNNCSVGNCDVFPASGMVKLLVLIEAFRRIEEGTLKRTDRYILKEEDYPKSREKTYGALEYLHVGTEVTVEDLYKLNAITSDNMAFNILLKLFGQEEVNHTIQKYGCRKTRINRALLDDKESARGVKNYVSVQEIANLLLRMENGQIISRNASREILSILCNHQKVRILPYYFGENMEIAHHSGFDEREIMDMGIVYCENPFILCMAASADNTRDAESIMRDITWMCYEYSKQLNQNRTGGSGKLDWVQKSVLKNAK